MRHPVQERFDRSAYCEAKRILRGSILHRLEIEVSWANSTLHRLCPGVWLPHPPADRRWTYRRKGAKWCMLTISPALTGSACDNCGAPAAYRIVHPAAFEITGDYCRRCSGEALRRLLTDRGITTDESWPTPDLSADRPARARVPAEQPPSQIRPPTPET